MKGPTWDLVGLSGRTWRGRNTGPGAQKVRAGGGAERRVGFQAKDTAGKRSAVRKEAGTLPEGVACARAWRVCCAVVCA